MNSIGGGGGGIILVAARLLFGTGGINAKGGNGSDAVQGVCGAGGGGSGGTVILYTDTVMWSSDLKIDVSGGSCGHSSPTEIIYAAEDGSHGTVFIPLESSDLEKEYKSKCSHCDCENCSQCDCENCS
jgi:hypothetical protein